MLSYAAGQIFFVVPCALFYARAAEAAGAEGGITFSKDAFFLCALCVCIYACLYRCTLQSVAVRCAQL